MTDLVCALHDSAWRTEEARLASCYVNDYLVGALDLPGQCGLVPAGCRARDLVRPGVIAQRMPVGEDSPQHFRLSRHALADHEEGCLYLSVPQNIQDSRRPRPWTVVERKCHSP